MDDHRLAFFSLVLITPTLLVCTGIQYAVRRRKDSPQGLRIRVFVGLLITVTFGLKNLARALDACRAGGRGSYKASRAALALR